MMNPNKPPTTDIDNRGIADFPVADRIRLVEDIWDSIAMEPVSLPMTNAQRAELDWRLDAYASDGIKGDPADEVIKDIRSRLRR
uniref:Putative addiction module component, TIGR02574 family n=2 Tax=unclassified Candidatus Kentrum TaxID=2643149 RepID=A0A451APY0_9GAMM|nr:MAG: putative addiction module component, TIGR02574 family [Candidatus Kentron sp. LPFa]VFK68083.1 MAG: putative addiction module component, TIGR02574 family [Candidatus Kentron sp. UNK]VFK73347.1 MAG: putative addiction module component, TIGR02574 family [Candidatus Kentron sp. UNK]